ncbi:MAG: hypothetical protein B6245_16470 [Desulfobacteraceae bacterium 4572_88]|nr:MAG: hypothetical protein B6245_16470 [Desulfobacteraceae bacterium 4572_88]
MNNDLLLAVVLQIIGVSVIISEFVLPSAGLLTVTAMAAFGYSLFHVFHHVSADVGIYFLAADVVVIPLCRSSSPTISHTSESGNGSSLTRSLSGDTRHCGRA